MCEFFEICKPYVCWSLSNFLFYLLYTLLMIFRFSLCTFCTEVWKARVTCISYLPCKFLAGMTCYFPFWSQSSFSLDVVSPVQMGTGNVVQAWPSTKSKLIYVLSSNSSFNCVPFLFFCAKFLSSTWFKEGCDVSVGDTGTSTLK